MSKKVNPVKVTLGSVANPVRFSYLNAFKAVPQRDDKGNFVTDEEGNKVKFYNVQVRFPKTDTAGKAAVDAAVQSALEEFFGDKKKIPPANLLQLPLRDGDAEADSKEDETLRGCWFFNCKSKNKPDVVGPKKDEGTGKFVRLDEDEIKSGDYGRITVGFYGFNQKSKGVAVSMGNIQKLKTGDALGSKKSAEEDFDEEDVEDDSTSDNVL